MSWWKGLVAKLVEAVAGWGQEKLTQPAPVPEPKRSAPRKVGKRVQ